MNVKRLLLHLGVASIAMSFLIKAVTKRMTLLNP